MELLELIYDICNIMGASFDQLRYWKQDAIANISGIIAGIIDVEEGRETDRNCSDIA